MEDQPYDSAYWGRYQAMDRTSTGEELTKSRCEWLDRNIERDDGLLVCDIGIGGGKFVSDYGCKGYDINPHAVDWLKSNGLYHDPYVTPVDAVTFWDSLEHIHDPAPLLANVRHWAFVSAPVFKDAEHILRSKHFRKDEHCWYFTRSGIMTFMEAHGFECVDVGFMEQDAGREDIETFAFKRFKHG